jgi:AcrR family transcriptional regulator
MDTDGMESKHAGAAPSPPPRLSREESKARTRERVLAAARAVFEREGYHGASLERIAAEAGFTKGAVYSTFESKADVMLALIASRAARRQQEMEELSVATSDPWEALAAFSRRFGTETAAERDWWTAVIEFMVVVGRDEELRARYAKHHEASRRTTSAVARRWMGETGTRLEISPERLATAAMALNIGLTVESLLAPAEVPQGLYAEAQLSLFRGAVEDGESP